MKCNYASEITSLCIFPSQEHLILNKGRPFSLCCGRKKVHGIETQATCIWEVVVRHWGFLFVCFIFLTEDRRLNYMLLENNHKNMKK